MAPALHAAYLQTESLLPQLQERGIYDLLTDQTLLKVVDIQIIYFKKKDGYWQYNSYRYHFDNELPRQLPQSDSDLVALIQNNALNSQSGIKPDPLLTRPLSDPDVQKYLCDYREIFNETKYTRGKGRIEIMCAKVQTHFSGISDEWRLHNIDAEIIYELEKTYTLTFGQNFAHMQCAFCKAWESSAYRLDRFIKEGSTCFKCPEKCLITE